ncbi:MAG: Nif11-like leader peptide family natural product precursor [Spirulinaceae cyanobacterium]
MMSQRKQVIDFFQTACQDVALQNRLKAPCSPTRQGFAAVARDWGYDFDGTEIDEFVRYHQFYEQFQAAVERHQQGTENLADWLNQWQIYLKRMADTPFDEREETIKRYL